MVKFVLQEVHVYIWCFLDTLTLSLFPSHSPVSIHWYCVSVSVANRSTMSGRTAGTLASSKAKCWSDPTHVGPVPVTKAAVSSQLPGLRDGISWPFSYLPSSSPTLSSALFPETEGAIHISSLRSVLKHPIKDPVQPWLLALTSVCCKEMLFCLMLCPSLVSIAMTRAMTKTAVWGRKIYWAYTSPSQFIN